MSYAGDTPSQEQERLKREGEAAAFLTSLGPQFRKARSTSPGPTRKVTPSQQQQIDGGGAVVQNGNTRHVVVPSGSNGATFASVTVSAEVEEKRQETLRRLKATHCSVNQDKVRETAVDIILCCGERLFCREIKLAIVLWKH